MSVTATEAHPLTGSRSPKAPHHKLSILAAALAALAALLALLGPTVAE